MPVPPGLYVTPAVFPPQCPPTQPNCGQCQACLIKAVDGCAWRDDLNRKTQHYGARYDYKAKKVVHDAASLSTCPPVLLVAQRLEPSFKLLGDAKVPSAIQQCIVNNYEPKQKITAHTDSKEFGPVIMTVSLGSAMMLKMTRAGYPDFEYLLQGGDVLGLTGDARYHWKHELLPSSDKAFRRVSFTYRSLV